MPKTTADAKGMSKYALKQRQSISATHSRHTVRVHWCPLCQPRARVRPVMQGGVTLVKRMPLEMQWER